jgi:hypothetical protein
VLIWLTGAPLLSILERIPRYLDWCVKAKISLSINMLQSCQIMILNLVDPNATSFSLALGDVADTRSRRRLGISSSSVGTSAALAPSTSLSSTSTSMSEEEFVQQVGSDQLTLAAFYAWKAQVLYLHGDTASAWASSQKAYTIRAFIANLGPECCMVFFSAIILLDLIDRAEVIPMLVLVHVHCQC